ncbi:MAG: Hint domain-containing protein [Ruminococcus sp.]|nr:Hint domain-containing protein [Ruminococcus sp.]
MWRARRINNKKNSTTTTSYTPSEQEVRLQEISADYAEAVAPNALWLNDMARSLLEESLGTIQVDYNDLLNSAQQQATAAQQGVANLTTGELPQEYLDNMTSAIQSTLTNTMGESLNNLGSRGVLNSSVTSTALNDISTNAANSVAENYLNNISTLNGLYGQQSSLAGSNISLAAAAQQAAQQPALNLWNASLGLDSSSIDALNAISGTGTTTTTSSGGNNFYSGLFSAAASYACFTEDAKIQMADGTTKFIRHIEPGDEVMSYNPETGEDETVTVTEIMTPVYSNVYSVICDSTTSAKNYVSTTLTQPLLTEDGEFTEVSLLRIGTKLMNIGKVRSVIYSGERKVYDLKVSGANTYYANGFIAKGATDEW